MLGLVCYNQGLNKALSSQAAERREVHRLRGWQLSQEDRAFHSDTSLLTEYHIRG